MIRVHISEVEAERIARRNLRTMLKCDHTYNNTQNPEDQAIRASEIEALVWYRIEEQYIIN